MSNRRSNRKRGRDGEEKKNEVQIKTVPVFRINLDNDVTQRWTEVLSRYREAWGRLSYKTWNGFADASESSKNQEKARKFVEGLRDAIIGSLAERKGAYKEFAQEIEAFGDSLECDTGTVVLVNLSMEAVACTSVVCESARGPWLARTMDWSDAAELKAVSITCDAYRGNKPLYTAAFFPGVVGVLTGMRREAYSIAVNFRDDLHADDQGDNDDFLVPAAMAVRYTLERYGSFAAAVEYLRGERVMSPCYVTVAGTRPGEGVVLALSERGVDKEIWLSDVTPLPYVVQCNMDAWDACAEDHQQSKPRIAVAEEWLQTHVTNDKVKLNASSMWDMLALHPIWEEPETVYGTVMHARDSLYESKVDLRAPSLTAP